MTVHLFPTQPRLEQPLPIARGWLILGAWLLSWGFLYGIGFGLLALIRWLS